jgi:hypothetical protein
MKSRRNLERSACPFAIAWVCMTACAPASQGLGTDTGAEPVTASTGASTSAMDSEGSGSSAASASSVGSATSASSVDGTTTVDATTSLATSNGTTSDDTTSGAGSSSGDSSGGSDPTAYPPCADADPRCPEPYEGCIEPMDGAFGNACTLLCNDPSECPVPDSGGATIICAAPMMMSDFCQLDCSRGPCPDGMACVGLGPMGQALRCLWPPT